MNNPKKILAISGSTKKNSTNSSITRFISESYRHIFDVELFEEIDQLPHFNPDLDNQNPPEAVIDFRARINSADGIIICTPEYVFSLPGVLKNAIEWTVSTTVFSNKPVAIIVASASGQKAFESLYLVMTTIEAVIPEDSRLLIQGAKGKIQPDGTLRKDTVKQIDKLAHSLIHTIAKENQVPTKYTEKNI